MWFLFLGLLLVGCRSDSAPPLPPLDSGHDLLSDGSDAPSVDLQIEMNHVEIPPLPAPDDDFVLGAAGAPRPLFGPDSSPTFRSGYEALKADGFNEFVPVFLTTEAGGGTGHLTYFLPPLAALGVTDAISCESATSGWDVPDGFKIAFPAYIVALDLSPTALWDQAVIESRLSSFLAQCLGGDTRRISKSYLHDEPANNYVASLFDQDPAEYNRDNVEILAAASRAVLGGETMMVEAPLPFFLPIFGVAPGDRPPIEDLFWETVDRFAPLADHYGFDLYPVDITTDFSSIGGYVDFAKQRAPNATPFFVLQGSGYADTEIDIGDTGRRPTRDETRAMTWIAVIAGSRALYWYGQSATFLEDNSLWDDIREVVQDVRRISGLLTRPATVQSRGVFVRAIEDGEKTWLIIANPTDQPAVFESGLAGAVFDVTTGSFLERSEDWDLSLGAYASGVYVVVR